MRTVVLGRSDPLLALLLAAVGVTELGGCGGRSQSNDAIGTSAGLGGVSGAGAPAGVGAGPSPAFGGQEPGVGGASDDSEPPYVPGRPRQEGVVPCNGVVPYPVSGTGFEIC